MKVDLSNEEVKQLCDIDDIIYKVCSKHTICQGCPFWTGLCKGKLGSIISKIHTAKIWQEHINDRFGKEGK